jgi:transposase
MVVIPPRNKRIEKRVYHRHLYEDRKWWNASFNRLTQFRRIATRYEKLARNFASMRNLICAYMWLA